MEQKLCVFCGKPSVLKYCDSVCKYKAKLARRRKLYKSVGKHICLVCMKPVTDSYKKLHDGRCTEIAKNRTAEKKKLTRIKKNIIYEKLCEFCNEAFQSKFRIRRYCFSAKCFNERAKRNNKCNRKLLIEKKETVTQNVIKTKKHSKEIFIKFARITARCPRCSILHDIRVVKGSSKWIYCNNCRNTVYYGNYGNELDAEGNNNRIAI